MVSYQWLQTFFDGKLPSPEKIAEALTFGAFEIETVEEKNDDTIIDVKVLPDRACYALSHRGIAKEIATLCDVPIMRDPLAKSRPEMLFTDRIHVATDEKRCAYYSAALIENVSVAPSPDWLRKQLEAIGQRSINNVVDATNYVMNEIGTPLHAFDAEKMGNGIVVRPAHEGERITILGGEEKVLTEAMTVIADGTNDVPLAIAGVKGGARAEVTNTTTRVVLEAATFHPTVTRKTAQVLNLRTDASKRFENGVSAALPLYGLEACATLIADIAGGKLAGIAEAGSAHVVAYKLGVSVAEVNRLLGTALNEKEVRAILTRLGLSHEKVENPRERLLEIAKEQLGKPYKYGASVSKDAPDRFDCSSFISWSAAQVGISMPRMVIDQCLFTETIAASAALPGDLIFAVSDPLKRKPFVFTKHETGEEVTHFNPMEESQEFMKGARIEGGVSHDGIYLGDGLVLHASSQKGEVIIENYETSGSFQHIVSFNRFFAVNQERLVVTVPPERLDLRIPQDLVEEIGRVHGYEHIAPTTLPSGRTTIIFNQRHRVMETVRKTLEELGYMEIMTYALIGEGEVTLANSLAPERAHLRASLVPAMQEALDKNYTNAPLLGGEPLKLFEIGTVFTHDSEFLSLALGVRAVGKRGEEKIKALLQEARSALALSFGVHESDIGAEVKNGILTCDLSSYVDSGVGGYPETARVQEVQYRPPSVFPFVLRDVALWVTAASADEVAEVIRGAAGTLLASLELFDTFAKNEKTSFAYHLVFQSNERTLSDNEVSEQMTRVESALKAKGWEIR